MCSCWKHRSWEMNEWKSLFQQPCCMSLLRAPLPLGASEDRAPGAVSLQAEPTSPITECAEEGRFWPPSHLHLRCFPGEYIAAGRTMLFHNSPPGPHPFTATASWALASVPHPTAGILCLFPRHHRYKQNCSCSPDNLYPVGMKWDSGSPLLQRSPLLLPQRCGPSGRGGGGMLLRERDAAGKPILGSSTRTPQNTLEK